jgi:uncharacterized protein YndB with AHSA1/START domain
MTTSKTITTAEGRDLILTRVFDAPREKVFKAWSDSELMEQWFAPKPWAASVVKNDVHTGGSSLIILRGPQGEEFPCPGIYLEVIENEKIVSTDAFTEAWVPSQKAFMVVTLTFEAVEGNKTRYTARVSHWNEADREEHEKMGFHEGWKVCAEQLAALIE